VTLSGTVSDRYQKRRAEDCVEHVLGVSHMQNNLRIEDQTTEKTGGLCKSAAYLKGRFKWSAL